MGFWLFPRFRQRRLMVLYRKALLGNYRDQPRHVQASFNQKVGRSALYLGGISFWLWMAVQQMLLLSPYVLWLLLFWVLAVMFWLVYAVEVAP